MKRRIVIIFGSLAVAVAIGGFLLFTTSLSALDEPSRLETRVATGMKHVLVHRQASKHASSRPADLASRAAVGGMQFRGSCAACHGLDGRTPSDIGRAMYPHASDLGSVSVQQWSDEELFWIVKHGIRLTGMPGFGRNMSDDEIWPLVAYIRTLRAQPVGRGR